MFTCCATVRATPPPQHHGPASRPARPGPDATGCGKSTLARLLTLVEPPSSGTLHVAGQNTAQADAATLQRLRKRVLPRVPGGGRQTVAAALDEPLSRHTPWPAADRHRRVALARALMLDPAVVVANLPTAGLDADGGAAILDLIVHLQAATGTALVMLNRDAAMAQRVAHEVLRLDEADGRLARPLDGLRAK
jgi:dipeptide transport system ATP-binding protein